MVDKTDNDYPRNRSRVVSLYKDYSKSGTPKRKVVGDDIVLSRPERVWSPTRLILGKKAT